MTFRRYLLAGALASGLLLTGCTGTPLDNAVEGLVDQGVEQLQGGVDQAIGDALGGADLSTDGQVPEGFPTDTVPLTGEVRGGGAGPNGSGWVAQTVLGSAADYEQASQALEDAGFTASVSNSDANSAFGQFTGNGYSVVLTVASEQDAVVATYIVTPA
ncbi:hypothetical protein CLV46_1118 [Diaminobutyricimonas aerilata]|uniref:LytR cell envelope-related transcriptional attenuator n=1 Tax=Diaminobutyricimonas aerilata TaxID=1162967 RepID=A0A2M9CI74_9MICO|nr:hypothetical protein [Diaminobutyricimonas aerilata]PJJ71569.1 hypothetical protein CLV46_1118 [Diaminobutyricimonas aerilata]